MESDVDAPSPANAAELLRRHSEMRDRVGQLGPSRSFARLSVWSALALAVYLAAFLLSFSAGSGQGENGGTAPAAYTNMLLFPFLLFGALIAGAQERFSIRSTGARTAWIPKGLVLGAFIALFVLNLLGVDYPWWLNVFVVLAAFVALAFEPLRLLRHAPATPASERWTNQPLSPAARRMTALIGVAAGALLATSSESWFLYVSLLSMLFLVLVLVGWRARWGLLRTGYEWGPLHWGAFGITMSILFLVGVLLSRTNWVSAPVAIATGATALLVMVAASALPVRGTGD